MKYISLFSLLFIACQAEKQYFLESPEIDFVKKANDAYVNGEWDALRSYFADTASIYNNTWFGEEITPDEYINGLRDRAEGYASYSFSDDGFYEMVINDRGEKWVHAWIQWRGTLENGDEVKTVVNINQWVENEKIVAMGVVINYLPMYLAAEKAAEVEKVEDVMPPVTF